MAKTETTEVVAADVAPAETGVPMTLDEFCIRLSVKDKRVELIGGFEHVERLAGRVKDTADGFGKRFADFINQPA